MNLIYKAIPNTAENRAQLDKGASHVVLYRHCRTSEQITVTAPWNGQDFDYCQHDFISPGVIPSLEQEKDKHLVIAFANAKHYTTEEVKHG